MTVIKRKMSPYEVFRVISASSEQDARDAGYTQGKVIKGYSGYGSSVSEKFEGLVIVADENGDLEYFENSDVECKLAEEYLHA